MQEILLNVESKEIRLARLKNGILDDLIIERKKDRQITGNIYKGQVKNILHNIQSAFIDIYEGENGFIHISDVIENIKKFEDQYDLDFERDTHSSKASVNNKNQNIEQILKIDQPVLVQVVKEPIGSKGARLTSNISIAGRFLVLLPNSSHRGVSRKIEDRLARDRLKKIIRNFEMPQDMGLICRTSSTLATQEMLIDEATELLNSWEDITEKFKKMSEPGLLYAESDIIKRAVITAVDKRYDRLLIDDWWVYQIVIKLYSKYAREYPLKIDFYRDKMPMFERFNIEKEIEKSLRRKIWLPSGGYLFFDKTEAMYTVDVNSGRSKGGDRNVEEALVKINMEASVEIARQLRLRNIGGLIICDFIDMQYRKNQRRVLEKLKDCMKEDSAKCCVLNMSEFGLVEMTRQRSRGSLINTFFTVCPYCSGSGLIKTNESISIEIERKLKKAINLLQQYALKIVVHPVMEEYLATTDKDYFIDMAEKMNAHLEITSDDNLHLNDYNFISTINDQILEI